MFFPQRITKIGTNDNVLEIGPGADPHPRSDVLLELRLDEKEYVRQFGQEKKLVTDKKVVFYDGNKFPFEDGAFDYVICSHVLEHVPDVERFLSEVFRVGKRGYFEYPLVTYEYLYNFEVHLNFLKWDGKKVLFMKKDTTHLDDFRPVQEFMLEMLRKNYDTHLKKIPELFIEGFEWETPFEAVKTARISDLMVKGKEIAPYVINPSVDFSFGELVKAMVRKIRR